MGAPPPSSLARPGRSGLRLLAIAAGVAFSVTFTYLAVRNVDFALFAETLADSAYWWFLPAVAVHFLAVAVRVLRWRLLFSPARRPPLRALADAILVGYLFDSIAPLRA